MNILRRPLTAAISARIRPQRHAVAAKQIALPDPALFHRKDKPDGDVAYIDEVDDEIEIDLEAPVAEKMLQHGGRRREIVIVRTDRHRRAADDHRQTRSRRPATPDDPPAFSSGYRDPASFRRSAQHLRRQHHPVGGHGTESIRSSNAETWRRRAAALRSEYSRCR